MNFHCMHDATERTSQAAIQNPKCSGEKPFGSKCRGEIPTAAWGRDVSHYKESGKVLW
jgi:hypothetical protein